MTEEGQRSAVVGAAADLFRSGVMSHSGHANLSCRLAGGRILITARGSVRDLGPDELAVVGPSGELLSGEMEPIFREIVDMHAVVYRQREEVGGVVHTHSPHLLAFALAQRELPCRYEAQLRFGQTVPVPVVPWAPRGTPAAVARIEERPREVPRTGALLLRNHGVLAFAATVGAAAGLLTVLEEEAAAELGAAALGGARDLPRGAHEAAGPARAR